LSLKVLGGLEVCLNYGCGSIKTHGHQNHLDRYKHALSIYPIEEANPVNPINQISWNCQIFYILAWDVVSQHRNNSIRHLQQEGENCKEYHELDERAQNKEEPRDVNGDERVKSKLVQKDQRQRDQQESIACLHNKEPGSSTAHEILTIN
jgi:hypothetical protein